MRFFSFNKTLPDTTPLVSKSVNCLITQKLIVASLIHPAIYELRETYCIWYVLLKRFQNTSKCIAYMSENAFGIYYNKTEV